MVGIHVKLRYFLSNNMTKFSGRSSLNLYHHVSILNKQSIYEEKGNKVMSIISFINRDKITND